ncbi:Zinc-binding in reverse transcriptase domain-containing protein [Plakobranchus ocellatus]|uniref:Zinc-binding in reverse transcriptase domain-containing protein n=1 Tax=Plakobranchus ocellatus TaxID=259542 RepID=A0AAV4D9Y1_9GAST|nr:Zinc-binding in reverse transcriptase domain-containing protein [Plakobranchus ocellatus]
MAPLRMSFLIRSVYDLLSSNANLVRWGKKDDPTCPLHCAKVKPRDKSDYGKRRHRWNFPLAVLNLLYKGNLSNQVLPETVVRPMEPVHNKVISGFKAPRQAGAPMAGLEPATEGSLQISGRTHKPLCHRRPRKN